MSIFRVALATIASLFLFGSVFASEEGTGTTASGNIISTGTTASGLSVEEALRQAENEKRIEDARKEQAKTIEDINNFLIESYKIKIDKILADLNTSIDRATNNDPVAKTKLLTKIRAEINAKIQIINSRRVSENRRFILSSIFLYIQENLDAEIQKIAQKK